MSTHSKRVNNIWNVKELLRDRYKRHEYGKVILPLTVLRRLESVLAPTRAAVVAEAEQYNDSDIAHVVLEHIAKKVFYNTSKFTFANLLDDEDNIIENWLEMIRGFSPNAREMIKHFRLEGEIENMGAAGTLFLVTKAFSEQDLSRATVTNVEMGYIYEELVRLTADLSNEEAGEHFTPREVIELMVNLVFSGEDELFSEHKIARIYDPTCGTGGMLTASQDFITSKNDKARVHLYGQEIQPESFATCQADMMLEDRDSNIEFGDTLKPYTLVDGERVDGDAFPTERFSYMFANPPYGKDWKSVEKSVKAEHANQGFEGRFGAGLPSTSDGQILFVQHMISKMLPPEEGGSRIAVVMNGSPLFSGGAGSDMSEIRRWIIENDWLDAIVGLPDQMFYNTGIPTYIWIIDNDKRPERAGHVQLIDARQMFKKMRKSLGNKRNELSPSDIAEITRIYELCADGENSRIVRNEEFGSIEVTVERPLRQRYEVTPDSLVELGEVTAIQKLSNDDRDRLFECLRAAADSISVTDDDVARAAVRNALTDAGVKGKPIETAVLKAIAVHDEDAEPSVDAKGRPLPDPTLRDTETIAVPLERSVSWTEAVGDRFEWPEYREAIEVHMRDEVLPYLPDAYVDWTRSRIGYDLPFTRRFYTYDPPRPLEEIRADLSKSQQRILELLTEVGA